MTPRRISILGATGSIGRSTVDLLRATPDAYRVEALVAGRDVDALAALAREFRPAMAVVADAAAYSRLKDALAGTSIEIGAGPQAVLGAAARPADWTMAAIVGIAGLAPTLEAIKRGGTLALANKECLVCAGTAFLREAKEAGVSVLPVDSEHNAIFQALGAGRMEDVARIAITASGGPFREASLEAMARVQPEEALRHPTWSMGPKVTIDSATLMNKGLELIEAHYLFGLPAAQIDVLVHPQSIVHGLVTWRDGSVVAGLAPADMRVPIAHALGYPARLERYGAPLDLAALGTLSFERPDMERFPALRLAREALDIAGGPTVLNAANEVAVAAFLDHRLGFLEIARLCERTLETAISTMALAEPETLEDALALDAAARKIAEEILPTYYACAG